ncbi:MAG: ATP-binding protein [Proteobacteria bacterium]|nr:MAG: ATP-binding protein [Pseudomonadota bacterium]QKK11968.1 MAG: ATP-binding protein [Pseudomonadota bacterium]
MSDKPATNHDALVNVVETATALLERVEHLLPHVPQSVAWEEHVAFRWRRRQGRGWLEGVRHPHTLRLQDLLCIDRQKDRIQRNTRQFVQTRPANNVLLWGSRGTGKSSLIKALLNEYATQGLRLIEVDKHDLLDLPDIVDLVWDRPERFMLFCDDLSFEAEDPSYKALKALLDGSISAAPNNLLIYATSNRRHLLPEYFDENLEARNIGGEIHHGEAVEEKISLSDRFGLWISFYPFRQEEFLDIVHYWLQQHGVDTFDTREIGHAALQWALARGSRSGRTAYQFARDWAGRSHLE